MAQVFTAQDIAVIAGAFQPVSPTQQKPSLVWNSAGDHLLQSTKTSSKFVQLLARDNGRVLVASLPKALDTRQSDWYIKDHTFPLLYSADKQKLIPEPEQAWLIKEVKTSTQDHYIELDTFLHDHDLDKNTFKSVLSTSEIELVSDSKHKTWLASATLHTKTTEELHKLLRESPDDHKTDLTAALPDTPRTVLQSLADQILSREGISGTIKSSKTRITFYSAAYESMLKEQQAKKIAREFSKILVHTHRYGYHPVPENSEESPGLREVFFERTQAGLADGSFSMIHSGDTPIALAFTNQLEVVLDELKQHSNTFTSTEATTTAGLDATRIEELIDNNSSPDFAKLVLEDARYRKVIQDNMKMKMDELHQEGIQRCNDAFNEYVRLPMRLYLAGLNNVKDTSLRQRLEDYVLEFLSKDLVPNGIQHCEDEKGPRDQASSKEIGKFGQTCLEANSLYELQSSLSKFAKKQKLESVSLADELEVKHRILQQKLKAMKRMIRGSDILQNLVWILLAQEHEGLYVSSGRDTTRMIRFYQSTGDEEISQKLENWKDSFKAGQESRQDFEDMRSLAELTIEQISKDDSSSEVGDVDDNHIV